MTGKKQGPANVYEMMVSAMPQLNLPRANGKAMHMAVLPAQLWLRWQADFLKAVAPLNAAWIKRRQEGTAAALQALEKLAACDSPAEAAEIQREWMKDEMQRLESDFRVAGAQATALPQELAKAGQRAASAMQEVREALSETEGSKAA